MGQRQFKGAVPVSNSSSINSSKRVTSESFDAEHVSSRPIRGVTYSSNIYESKRMACAMLESHLHIYAKADDCFVNMNDDGTVICHVMRYDRDYPVTVVKVKNRYIATVTMEKPLIPMTVGESLKKRCSTKQ